jgi:O-acetyl-ADP-ribose deacetylase (regulator of RNase III)
MAASAVLLPFDERRRAQFVAQTREQLELPGGERPGGKEAGKREGGCEDKTIAVRILCGDLSRSLRHAPRSCGCFSQREDESHVKSPDTCAVVNAANRSSFTYLDAGVSGALRDLCAPEVGSVVGRKKRILVDSATGHSLEQPLADVRLEETQVGVQESAGGLRSNRGVDFILHALAPCWKDYTVDLAAADSEDKLVEEVAPKIYATVRNALRTADELGVHRVVLPSLAGGIFTHRGFDDASRKLAARERDVAREVAMRAVRETTNSLQFVRHVDFVTLQSDSALLEAAFDDAFS